VPLQKDRVYGERGRVHFQTRSKRLEEWTSYVGVSSVALLALSSATLHCEPSRSCIFETAQPDERTSPATGSVLYVSVRCSACVQRRCLVSFPNDPRQATTRCELFDIPYNLDAGLLTGNLHVFAAVERLHTGEGEEPQQKFESCTVNKSLFRRYIVVRFR
jgi:hypothetical protein